MAPLALSLGLRPPGEAEDARTPVRMEAKDVMERFKHLQAMCTLVENTTVTGFPLNNGLVLSPRESIAPRMTGSICMQSMS